MCVINYKIFRGLSSVSVRTIEPSEHGTLSDNEGTRRGD